MATKLEDFEFKRTGRVSKYPWAQWADGDIWHLKGGEDFTGTAASVRTLASSYAKRTGVKVRTAVRKTENGEDLILQFYSPNGTAPEALVEEPQPEAKPARAETRTRRPAAPRKSTPRKASPRSSKASEASES